MGFWTTLLIIHGLLAVTLLGAITHQTVSVLMPVRTAGRRSFVTRFRGVSGPSYAVAVIVLYVLTATMGAWIYTRYRIGPRLTLEQLGYWKTFGAFELKEHFVAIGLAMLPAYWYYWRQPLSQEHAWTRAGLTAFLCTIVWYGFIVGHLTNNIRGYA